MSHHRVDPAYAKLAYKKAVLQETISFLQRQFVGAGGDEPKERVICEDVFQVDSVVPLEDIQEFVHDLVAMKLGIEVEMGEYNFRKRANGQQHSGSNKSQGQKSRSLQAKNSG